MAEQLPLFEEHAAEQYADLVAEFFEALACLEIDDEYYSQSQFQKPFNKVKEHYLHKEAVERQYKAYRDRITKVAKEVDSWPAWKKGKI